MTSSLPREQNEPLHWRDSSVHFVVDVFVGDDRASIAQEQSTFKKCSSIAHRIMQLTKGRSQFSLSVHSQVIVNQDEQNLVRAVTAIQKALDTSDDQRLHEEEQSFDPVVFLRLEVND